MIINGNRVEVQDYKYLSISEINDMRERIISEVTNNSLQEENKDYSTQLTKNVQDPYNCLQPLDATSTASREHEIFPKLFGDLVQCEQPQGSIVNAPLSDIAHQQETGNLNLRDWYKEPQSSSQIAQGSQSTLGKRTNKEKQIDDFDQEAPIECATYSKRVMHDARQINEIGHLTPQPIDTHDAKELSGELDNLSAE
jgi:hypothetical protein